MLYRIHVYILSLPVPLLSLPPCCPPASPHLAPPPSPPPLAPPALCHPASHSRYASTDRQGKGIEAYFKKFLIDKCVGEWRELDSKFPTNSKVASPGVLIRLRSTYLDHPPLLSPFPSPLCFLPPSLPPFFPPSLPPSPSLSSAVPAIRGLRPDLFVTDSIGNLQHPVLEPRTRFTHDPNSIDEIFRREGAVEDGEGTAAQVFVCMCVREREGSDTGVCGRERARVREREKRRRRGRATGRWLNKENMKYIHAQIRVIGGVFVSYFPLRMVPSRCVAQGKELVRNPRLVRRSQRIIPNRTE